MGKRLSVVLLAPLTLALAVLIGACSKSSSPTGPGAGSVITVTGKVIGINSQPVASVPVLVSGLPSANTDANGSFTIANVTIPYTVTVVDGTNKRALVYRGLMRGDPTLVWLGTTPGTSHSATVSGKLVPWTQQGAGVSARVAYASPDAVGGGNVTLATGAFSVTSTWYGPTTTTGTVYALQWSYDANGLPTTFSNFGKRTGVALLDGTTNANQNDTIGVAQTGQISGTVSIPAGYTLTGRNLAAVFESKASIVVLSDASTVPNFTYNTPNVTGVQMSLVAAIAGATGSSVESFLSGLAVNQTGITMTIPAAPELSLPVASATNITTSTPFSWTQFAGGVHILEFNPAVTGQPSYLVLTSATSDSIPNLTSAGLTLPSSATYKWSVIGVAPFASVDAAAGTGGVLGFITNTSAFTGSFGNSATRSFTTAP